MFASICTPIISASTLSYFSYRTNSRINPFHATEKDILIIKSLDATKAHGYDNLSVRTIKVCNESVTIPLKIIFIESLKNGLFLEIWKRANVVPVHKKEDKSIVKNYCPISLLPIFRKIYKIYEIFNSLFNYFISNKLFTPFQSHFLPGESSIAQLLSIIHEIQTAFDENPTADVRGVFLDISKAFDKAWHGGLLYNLKAYGVQSEVLSLLRNYLQKRKQRVVLNGQTEWREIISGVQQGSVLRPLLFLIDNLTSLCKIFADDTSLFSKVDNINKSVNELSADLEKNSQYAYQWKMQSNPDLNKEANEVVFSRKSDSENVFHPPIKFNNSSIAKCPCQKHLGIVLDSKLNFNSHADEKILKM